MTLIAFATYGADRIELVTDSASYTRRVSAMGRCSKHLTIPHLDAAVLSQGNSSFGVAAKTGLLTASGLVASFDELTDQTPELLRTLHASAVDLGDAPADDESVVFLLGWSDRDAKFRAWGYATDDAFEPFKIPGLWVMPAPWSMRPSRLELARMRRWMADHPDVEQAAHVWGKRDPSPAPRSVEDWVDLAITAREQRSLSGGFAHVIVAGDVFHTRIKRGSIETRKVHTFDDSGEEFLTMVEYTEHPIALAGPCYCESGKTFGECHATELPCGCRSGQPFGQCHGKAPVTA